MALRDWLLKSDPAIFGWDDLEASKGGRMLLQRRSRLSVQPVAEAEWKIVLKMRRG